jgi:hypothetical protein
MERSYPQTVDISAGVAIVNGMRIEFVGETGFRMNTVDDYYIGIDSLGCIVYGESTDLTDPLDFPFKDAAVALLGYVEAHDRRLVDLRLFVDHIDYKYLGDVTISNDQRFGHFTSIHKAIDYARMFSRIFEDTGVPSILVKEGTYIIEDTIYIDFDIKISGVGPGTIIKRGGDLINNMSRGSTYNGVFFIGAVPEDEDDHSGWVASGEISEGVTLENFTYIMDNDYHAKSTVINLQQNIDASPSSCFRFSNINFKGNSSVEHEADSADYPWEFSLRIGRGVGGSYGNVIFSNNFIDWMGYGNGAVYLDAGNLYDNILITNNISLNVYGAAGVQSGLGYGVMSAGSWTSSTLTRVIETNNISDDQ